MAPLCLAFALFPVLLHAQNSYTVSNVPGSNANFKTLQGAHDSVVAGSTLYVLPSSNTYGNAIFTKKLTVYGTGYYLGANLAPNTQANTGAVIVNSITFRAGSDNSYIEGLQLTDISTSTSSLQRLSMDTVSNIIVSRCYFTPPNAYYNYYFYFSNTSNIIVKQCYFDCQARALSSVVNMNSVTVGFSGVQFNNSIFDFIGEGINGFSMMTGLANGVTANATCTNNTILSCTLNSGFGNFNYTNNIFVNTTVGGSYGPTYALTGGTNLYNIATVQQLFPATGNNMLGANTDSMFVGSQSGYHSTDQKWMLRDNNFATTFGQGGIPAGAYGGSNPYKLSGIPAIPYVYSLNVPSQATSPGTIGIHIKARATN